MFIGWKHASQCYAMWLKKLSVSITVGVFGPELENQSMSSGVNYHCFIVDRRSDRSRDPSTIDPVPSAFTDTPSFQFALESCTVAVSDTDCESLAR